MRLAVLVVVVVALAGCRRDPTYSSSGDVMEVDAGAPSITLSHDDIPGLMGPMTMTFPLRSADLVAGLVPGARVRFELVRRGDALIVTRLEAADAVAGPRRGVHDHTPHHGGVVTMVGMLHLEAVAVPPERVRVYLSDVWRAPLSIAGATGSVTVRLGDGRRELPLVPRDDALEADGIQLTGRELAVRVQVKRAAQSEAIEAHFMLPLGGGTSGAAAVPLDGCVPPAPAPGDGARRPRCVLRFTSMVSGVATTPDGSTALVAVTGSGVSGWRMPAGEFVMGLAAPPAVSLPADAAPHADEVNAMAVSPDGREVATALEGRLPVFSVFDGRFVRELPAHRGVIRSLAWSPDGSRLLASLLYDPAAHLIAATDGREHHRLEVEREAAAVAFSHDGRLAAVASEIGPITLFELQSGEPAAVLSDGTARSRMLLFAGEDLVSAADGLRIWDLAKRSVKHHAAGAVVTRLAVAPTGGLVAAAGMDRTIRLHDLTTGATVEILTWHRSLVWGLAWSGATLISGDADGNVALWDVAPR